MEISWSIAKCLVKFDFSHHKVLISSMMIVFTLNNIYHRWKCCLLFFLQLSCENKKKSIWNKSFKQWQEVLAWNVFKLQRTKIASSSRIYKGRSIAIELHYDVVHAIALALSIIFIQCSCEISASFMMALIIQNTSGSWYINLNVEPGVIPRCAPQYPLYFVTTGSLVEQNEILRQVDKKQYMRMHVVIEVASGAARHSNRHNMCFCILLIDQQKSGIMHSCDLYEWINFAI